jgi:hypothetical protein
MKTDWNRHPKFVLELSGRTDAFKLVRRFFLLILIPGLIIIASISVSQGEEYKGPLKSRNQFPPFFMFITPLPVSPFTLAQGEARFSPAIDYSSIFVDQDSGNWEVLMDMELMVVDLMMEYGLTKNLTLTFQPVFVQMRDGFLDNFLESYHDKLGVSNYGRENRPKNEFGYWISYKGQPWVMGKEGGLHLADSLVSVKYSLFRNSKAIPLDLSFAYILKIPFGDSEYGFGSGHADHGLHFLSQVCLEPVVIYCNGGYYFLTDPETSGADIQVEDTISLFAGLEYLYDRNLSFLVQINYFSSPFQDTEFSQFDEGGIELDFGFVYQLSPHADFEFAFGEDLATSGVPDFTLHFRVSYSFPLG